MPVDILVERAKNGNKAAFEELFRDTHAQVFNFVRSLGLTYDEASDLTQDVYVRAWAKLGTLRSTDSFIAWLHQIARNATRDYYKHRSRQPETPIDMAEEMAGSPEQSPGDVAEARLLARAVKEGIAALPEAQRLPVVMHHLEGMSVADISRGLGVSFGTVLSRLSRGRAALARRLAPLVDDAEYGTRESNVLQDRS